METYKTSKEVRQLFGICSQTLHNWRKIGKIKFTRVSSRKLLYDVESLINTKKTQRESVIYARVSNIKQKDDLDRQISVLKEFIVKSGKIPNVVYSDIASGMNEDRQQFNQLLEHVFKYEIDTVYVSYKDRLSRFGFNYFQEIFRKFGTEIVVVNLTEEKDYQEELVEDLISIIHHFSMKMYSARRAQLKEFKKKLESE